MADIGQDKKSLERKVKEVQIRIRQKEAALFNIDTERLSIEVNIERLQEKMGDFDANVAEIKKQIESDKKDLASLSTAAEKAD